MAYCNEGFVSGYECDVDRAVASEGRPRLLEPAKEQGVWANRTKLAECPNSCCAALMDRLFLPMFKRLVHPSY